jgi:hypothetical protein
MATDSEYVTTSLMQVIEHLSNDYIQIIKSEVMLNPLCEHLKSEHNDKVAFVDREAQHSCCLFEKVYLIL